MIGRRLGRLRTWFERVAADDRGSATVWIVVIAPLMVAVIGVVYDGGRAVDTLMKASTVASQAARKGVDSVAPGELRTGSVGGTDPEQSACAWVATAMPDAVCHASMSADGSLAVRVDATSPTILSRIVGVGALSVTGEASAGAVTGVHSAVGGN